MVEKLLPLLHSYSAFIHRLFEIIGGGGGGGFCKTYNKGYDLLRSSIFNNLSACLCCFSSSCNAYKEPSV